MSPRSTAQVTGRDARFQRVETLRRNRIKRRRAGMCVVEGVLPIEAALRGTALEEIWYAHDRRLSQWARGVLDAAVSAQCVEVPGALLDELSDRDDGVELIAIAEIRTSELTDMRAASRRPVVVLDRPSSPGNIGAIVRTAAAFAIAGVVITGHGADPFDPKAIAAARGSVFAMPIAETTGADVIAWRDAERGAGIDLRLIAAAAAGGASITSADLSGPLAFILGNEQAGLSHGFQEACDLMVHIPIETNRVDSLNVAVAAGIALHECVRRRSAAWESAGDRFPD